MSQVIEDTKVTPFNVKDVSMKLPALKHKWVGFLIKHKRSLERLKKEKQNLKKNLTQKYRHDEGFNISESALGFKIESLDDIQSLNDKIRDEEMIIDYLERVEKIFHNMSFDIKNITELLKMELS